MTSPTTSPTPESADATSRHDDEVHAPQVALVCGNQRKFGSLARLLQRAIGKVTIGPSVLGIGPRSDYLLVAVDFDNLNPHERRELPRIFADDPPAVLLMSRGLSHADLATLFGSHVLKNLLVTGEAGVDLADLLVTLQKIRRGRIFGLEKYFGWGAEPKALTVRSSEDRADAIREVTSYARELGVATRLQGFIRTAIDEFLSNALYNAPTRADGSPRFASLPRTEAVQLDSHEAIEVRYCCDGRRFGLGVQDPFGSLQPTQIQDHLSRVFRGGDDQVRRSGGGAGLGFYQILDSLSHFVVNIEPLKRTEMIGIIDVSGGYRRFADSGKSFNVFVAEGRP